MTKYLLYILYASIFLLAGGCNNDIFVQPMPEIADSVILSGSGGSQTVKIRRRGLVGVVFDNDYSTITYHSFYDSKGNWIPDSSPMMEVAKIRYYSQKFMLECSLNGDELEIEAVDNAYREQIFVWMGLDYGYTVKFVKVMIDPVKPLEITEFGFSSENISSGFHVDRGIREYFHNNTDSTLRMVVYPYRDAKARMRLTPDSESYWSRGTVGKVTLPEYSDGEWLPSAGDMVETEIGTVTFFTPTIVDPDEESVVEVPPHSSVRVQVNVNYRLFSTDYEATLQLPNSHIIWMVAGRYELWQPVEYTMDITPWGL